MYRCMASPCRSWISCHLPTLADVQVYGITLPKLDFAEWLQVLIAARKLYMEAKRQGRRDFTPPCRLSLILMQGAQVPIMSSSHPG